MEQKPNAVFYGRDLKRQFPEDFRQAIAERLIVKIPINFDGYSGDDGKLRVILETENGFEAIDQNDPEAERVSLNIEDLTRYKLNMEAYAKRVQETNKLTGKAMFIGERLFFLGESRSANTATAYVLAFINDAPIMESVVPNVLNLLPDTYQTIVAVYPSHTPAITECNRLNDLGIQPLILDLNNCFTLPSGRSFHHSVAQKAAFELIGNHLSWNGRTQRLTDTQAAVIQILQKARAAGEPSLSWKQIQDRLVSFDKYPNRFRDVFRNSTLADTFIDQLRKGLYSLKI